jgi:hypothetical protein
VYKHYVYTHVHKHAGAETLLQAHYARAFGTKEGPEKVAALMEMLRCRRMAVSFEMVTGV